MIETQIKPVELLEPQSDPCSRVETPVRLVWTTGSLCPTASRSRQRGHQLKAIKKSALYSSLWKSCDELRGGMDASQYKDCVLVVLFALNATHRIIIKDGGKKMREQTTC